jgi:hypothetical protein
MIDSFSLGTITVEGKPYHSDVKIIDGRVVPDWWRRSGHTADIDDVHDILQVKPEVVVIGKGEPGQMRVTEAVRGYAREHGIDLIEQKTAAAVDTFNRLLREGRKVAAGFHISC